MYVCSSFLCMKAIRILCTLQNKSIWEDESIYVIGPGYKKIHPRLWVSGTALTSDGVRICHLGTSQYRTGMNLVSVRSIEEAEKERAAAIKRMEAGSTLLVSTISPNMMDGIEPEGPEWTDPDCNWKLPEKLSKGMHFTYSIVRQTTKFKKQ